MTEVCLRILTVRALLQSRCEYIKTIGPFIQRAFDVITRYSPATPSRCTDAIIPPAPASVVSMLVCNRGSGPLHPAHDRTESVLSSSTVLHSSPNTDPRRRLTVAAPHKTTQAATGRLEHALSNHCLLAAEQAAQAALAPGDGAALLRGRDTLLDTASCQSNVNNQLLPSGTDNNEMERG